MRVILIGATGTLGGAVSTALNASHHQVIEASRRGAVRVDLEEPSTLDSMFAAVPDADAVISCAASGALIDLTSATDAECLAGVQGKLFGQVALARRATAHLPDNGAVILTAGTFASPLRGGSLGAMVNGGLEAFVRNAASELPRGLRLNAVSPGWIRETLLLMGESGETGVPAAEVARHYVALLDSRRNGETVSVC